MSTRDLTALQLWGKELARQRNAGGLSQEALAKAVFVSPSLVASWELGRRAPKREDIEKCDEALRTDGILARLLTDWVSREVPPQWLGKWQAALERATTLLSFQPTVVDGLLQTEDYARAVLQAGRYYCDDVEDLVALRLERQKILERTKPPFLVVLLDESVLRRNVGGPRVMADQLRHLANMAERRKVVVQVVPLTAASCAGFAAPFVVTSLDDRSEVAYVDNQFSGDVIEDPVQVGILRELFERFRADAMSREASIEFIRKVVAEQWPVT